jgi:hypothetical protein
VSSVDRKAPVVRVFAARGKHRKTLRLRYLVSDDKGQTTERITVYRRTRALKALTRPLRPTDSAVPYWVSWRPAKAGSYRFCVRATDAAKNRSPLVCAAIRVR